MSRMLEQAIVDAEALKEAAIKNAEATIIEKYSNDIKTVVDQLLEQGPMMMPGAEEGPPPGPEMPGPEMPGPEMAGPATGPMPGPENVEQMPYTHEMSPAVQETMIVDLGKLKEELQLENDLDPGELETHALVAEELGGTGLQQQQSAEEETFVIEESVLYNILNEQGGPDWPGPDDDVPGIDDPENPQTDEPVVIPPPEDPPEEEDTYDFDIPGVSPGTPQGVMEEEELVGDDASDITTMYEHNSVLQHNLNYYHDQYAKLYEAYEAKLSEATHYFETSNGLKEQNEKLRDLLLRTQEKMNEINVQNAKLHYTNRTINNVSLNERQKDKIVEAVSRAGTVEEAKTIFETLQSAVAGANGIRKSPKSLNEAINKNSSAFLPRTREEQHSDPSLMNRMQKLAGIK